MNTGNSSGPNSLVTDANSALQRSTSFNNELYGRVPASPMSFNSVMDGSAIAQMQGGMSATSQLMEQDSSNVLNKKPRIGMRPEEIMQQHVIHSILQRQDSMQSQQAHQNMQLQSILQQQHRVPLRQPPLPQQVGQSFSPMQRAPAPIAFQQQQQQRHHVPHQAMQPVNSVKQSFDSAICSRRLMQYLYHQRHRQEDNSISYWRKFVAEYFAPQAKERWCLSMYDNIGKNTLGVFPQPAADAWQCDICGSKCGKGFEATFEVLPRLFQIKFDHAIVDEHLFLGMPHESRLPTGVMILEYKKAVQESVYKHVRVVREGILRIIFTPELKIFRWDFCAQRHEEFLPRRVMAPQVNQLLQVAQKYQNAVGSENGSASVSHQDLQASCNMFLAASHQLAKNLELQALNDLGFSKRYVRCLQISEVVCSMKDLIDYCQEHKVGPIESLKDYTKQATAKLQKQKMQESENMVPSQNMPADQSILNKVLDIHPGMSSQMKGDLAASNVLNANQQNMIQLNNYQNLLRNSLTQDQSQNQNMLRQEVSSTLSSVKQQGHSMQFQGSASLIRPNSFVNNTSCQFQQQPHFNGCLPQQNNLHPSQVNQQMQQHVIQQNNLHPSPVNRQMQQHVFQPMLQEMVNNNRGTPQPSSSTSNANGNLASGDVTDVSNNAVPAKIDCGPGKGAHETSSVFTSVVNNLSSAPGHPNATTNNLSSKPDLEDNLDLSDFDHIQDFDKGMFDGVGENDDIDWKM